MAYEQTNVSTYKSQEAIRALLIRNKILGVQFSETFMPTPRIEITFGYKTKDGSSRVVRYSIKLQMPDTHTKYGRRKAEALIQRDIEKARKQSMRILFYYLKSAFEAVEANLIMIDDVFMPFFVLNSGELLKEKLQRSFNEGVLALAEMAEK